MFRQALCSIFNSKNSHRGGKNESGTVGGPRLAKLSCGVSCLRSPFFDVNRPSARLRGSGHFAAVAGVAGPVSVSCSPSRPITVVYFHGTADTDFKMNPMMWAYFNRHPLP
jgi:hypothetical protein